MEVSTYGADPLAAFHSGRRDTLDRIMPIVYEHLRIVARHQQIAGDDQPEVMLDINDAVDRLAAVEPRLARVVECRFFGGLSEDETAEALGVTTRTVQRDWGKARMLLRRALSA